MSKSSGNEKPVVVAPAIEDDDGPDDWDKRISDTGCSAENEKLRFCFVDRKDWRLCKNEVAAFRECWEKHGNSVRTSQANIEA